MLEDSIEAEKNASPAEDSPIPAPHDADSAQNSSSSPLPAHHATAPAQNSSPLGGGREGAVGREGATTIFLPQNQDDLFVNFSTTPQPGSIFKATVSPDGRTASYEPLTLNFLQCDDHFKAISLTADSCLTDEATAFEPVAPGTIEKASEAGHTFWEIKQAATVRLLN